jgi:hypothetical protein
LEPHVTEGIPAAVSRSTVRTLTPINAASSFLVIHASTDRI